MERRKSKLIHKIISAVSKAVSWLRELAMIVFLILAHPIISPHCGISYLVGCMLNGLMLYVFLGWRTALIVTGIYLLIGIIVVLTFVLIAAFRSRQDKVG